MIFNFRKKTYIKFVESEKEEILEKLKIFIGSEFPEHLNKLRQDMESSEEKKRICAIFQSQKLTENLMYFFEKSCKENKSKGSKIYEKLKLIKYLYGDKNEN